MTEQVLIQSLTAINKKSGATAPLFYISELFYRPLSGIRNSILNVGNTLNML
jgi:hypothetical protein